MKKLSFEERMEQIRKILNREGEVSIEDIVLKLNLSPIYARTLLIYASKKLNCEFDGWKIIKKRKRK
jgi:DeoR/GlpR family transcriptional regulator of sugar metabolism